MTALALWTSDLVLLVTSADPVPEDSEVTPGPWMLIVVLLLVAASLLLWFSLRRHLRRIDVPGEDRPASDAAPGDREPHEDRQQQRPSDPPVS